MFPIITNEIQQNFEALATECEKQEIPCICGHCGRACRQMNKSEGANRFLCNGCPLAHYAHNSTPVYVRYEIYDCPQRPTDYGVYIGSTPILEQAQAVAAHGNRFIKGVTDSGQRVIFL